MAVQQYGSTENYQVTWLPDGSILITTEDEMVSSETLEFAVEIETGIQIDVYG
jgi:hypothetical protein